MSGGLLNRFEGLSDWLSPVVVKEVRQMVRTREFMYSFGLSLTAGLIVAVGGESDAIAGNPAAGSWVFQWLFGCLAIIGLFIAPIATFASLRSERMERTLDLVMLTTMSSRGIVTGKLLAQTVKLLTIFSGMAPFMATSYLLGGIDIVTILGSISLLFIWSIWACAVAMFFSSSVKTKAMSGLIVVALAAVYLYGFFTLAQMFGRGSFFMMRVMTAANMTTPLILSTLLCLITLINLVLLAENQLALEDEDRTYALRAGLLVQFLFVAAIPLVTTYWGMGKPATSTPGFAAVTSSYRYSVVAGYPYPYPYGYSSFGYPSGYGGPSPATPATRADVMYEIADVSAAQLFLEALILMTAPLTVSRRTRLKDKGRKHLRWLTWIFRPGGVRTIAYVLLQMAILLGIGTVLTAPYDFRWLLAFCGYICFFAAVPTLLFRLIAPKWASPIRLRAAVLLTFATGMIIPALADYFIVLKENVQPSRFRYILNPVITLKEWQLIAGTRAEYGALALGALGLIAAVLLMVVSRRLDSKQAAVTLHAG